MKASKLYLTAFLLSILLAVTAALTLASMPSATPIGSPAAELGLHFAGHLGGPARDIAVQEPYAYVAFGTELAVLDVSDRDNPRRVGFTILPSTINALAVQDSYAYVAARDGLYVVNIRTATSPLAVARLGTSHYGDVVVEGNYAYAIQGGSYDPTELHIIDIAHPSRPRIVSTFRHTLRTLAVGDGFVYLGGGGVSVLDVHDPTAPTLVASIDNVELNAVMDIAAQGEYLYVGGQRHAGYSDDCLAVLRHPEPDTLTMEGFVCTGFTNRAYNNLALSGQTVYLTGQGISPINVSNPERPTVLDRSRHAGDDLEIVGDYLYAIEEGNGLTILHMESRTQLTRMGSFETIGYAADMGVKDGVAYVADRGIPGYVSHYEAGGLKVATGAGPTGFQVIGSNSQLGSQGGIALEGERAYLAGGNVDARSSTSYGSLDIASIEEPGAPVLLGSLQLDDWCSDYRTPRAIAVIEGYAYVGYCGTSIIDVSDPHSPTLVTTLDFRMTDLATRGSYAYVAVEYTPTLQVFDVSQPQQPEQVNSLSIPAIGIAISDTYAFVAAGEQGVRVLDLSDPEEPTEVGAYDGPGQAQDVALWSIYAFVVEKEGVRVLDVSNPAQPVSLDFYHTPVTVEEGTLPERIVIADGLIYVADGLGGLFQFRWGPTYHQHLPLVSWP